MEKIDMDFGNFELDLHLGDSDTKAIDNFIEKVIPLFDGMTLRQIDLAMGRAKSLFECSHTIALRKKAIDVNPKAPRRH